MEDKANSNSDERIGKEAPQLALLLKEMKVGLDVVRSKVQALTVKVKADQFLTAEGISYLEAKHLLLLNYCQSLVYYLLRKANGFSVEGHPVIRSLVEIRLFLEKIRPIDKKLQYQIQKLSKATLGTTENIEPSENEPGKPEETEDLLKYRPNPDNLASKIEETTKNGVYRPPKFAPTAIDEDKKTSRQERNAARQEKNLLRKAGHSDYLRNMIDDLEGKPEEIREEVGVDSREMARYKAKMEDRARREEDLFTRAPITKEEKRKKRQMEKSRNGLTSLTDGFYDEIKSFGHEEDDELRSFSSSSARGRFKKHKRKH